MANDASPEVEEVDMFYIKADDLTQVVEIATVESLFHQELPYFADLDLRRDSLLHLRGAIFPGRGDGQHLLWNADTATWCFLDPCEVSVCRSLLDPLPLGELLHLEAEGWRPDERHLRGLLTHLYRRGLLAVEGRAGIDPGIFAQGPLYVDTFILELMLTETCNLACGYCFAEAGRDGQHMPPEVARGAIDALLALPEENLIIKLGGGEPLSVFPRVIELIEYTVEQNRRRRPKPAKLLFDLTTDGTLLTRRVIRALGRYPVRLCVSLDGPEDLHDASRPYLNGRGSHRDVVAAIRQLQRQGVPVRVLTVIRKPHVEKAAEIFHLYEELGITSVRCSPMTAAGRGGSLGRDDALTPDDYFRFMERLVDHISEHWSFAEDNIQTMLANLLFRSRDFTCMRSPCGAGNTYFNVDPEGRVHPCAYFRASSRELDLGRVGEAGFSFSSCGVEHPLMGRMQRRTVGRISRCSTCTWRNVCCGGCSLASYLEHGRFDRPSDLCRYYSRMYPHLLLHLRQRPQLISFLIPKTEVVRFRLGESPSHRSPLRVGEASERI